MYDNLKNDELLTLKGSTVFELDKVETELGFEIPHSLKEYLLITGKSSQLYKWGCDHHGTDELSYIYEWFYEWIERFRNQGFELTEIKQVLPFYKFQDTFLYVPIQKGLDNPPVYEMLIGDEPTIKKLNDNFEDYVSWIYYNFKNDVFW